MTTARPDTTRPDTTRTTSPRSRSGSGAGPGGLARGREVPRVPRRYGQWAATVLFLLVTVVAAGWLWQQKSDRVEVWQARVSIPAGSVIARDDLTTAHVAGVDAALRVGQDDRVVGSTASVGLVPGQVLSSEMVTTDPIPGPGQRVVGIAVDATRSPGGLGSGDVVTVLGVPPPGDASSPEELGDPTVLAERATVLSTGDADGGGTQLTLLVPQAQADRLVAFGAAGRVAVLQAPVGPESPGGGDR